MFQQNIDSGLQGLNFHARSKFNQVLSVEAQRERLPESHLPYTDTYFRRAKEILERDHLNPWVRAQVMIRQGPGQLGGLQEAIQIIEKYSETRKHAGRILALADGDNYGPGETIMQIDAPILDIVDLETMYLGVISAETTKRSEPGYDIDLSLIERNMRAVVEAAQGRPVIYFGARHWRYDLDAAIAQTCFNAGAVGASTDIGAATVGKNGVGTIPHVLENIYAWKYGRGEAVVESTKAFNRYIDAAVPRIALIDYNNREISDSLATAFWLKGNLYGVRVDTCGENLAQGAMLSAKAPKYWSGYGVTIGGVFALRQALDRAGFKDVKIVLSSGFADAEKVRAFVGAEKTLGVKLFDSLGVGGVYHSRSAKMDIVMVGETPNDFIPISKSGRFFKPNARLMQR